jgi:uncharacterized protein YjbJ (UPF0337 family)
MGVQRKIENSVLVLKGRLKQAAGRLLGNPRMQVEGRLEQGKGNLKQAGEKIRDAGKDVFGP